MLSSRPYLVRAVNEWIVDSGLTPHLLVDAEQPGLEVPPSSIQDGRVVLNISPGAVRDLLIDSEMVTFVARFGGVSQAVTVPMSAVEAVYARENGRGMMFPVDEDEEDGSGEQGAEDSDGDDKPDRKSRPNLKVVK
ncbi:MULTISPECIES: ClpXP protease specificity-enhancing factor [unclassified Wenzhouxiangella]|uniref:ClpXP protease specificity-enhancing factor n=1 Tax=unclassified Wenzhouxiangella TaxID=2613841 RepID=UPI000E32C304|nr:MULTISPECIES: ClpXP protease specificity-enhancing factor [unclassified Wenzhouxiangella]RFF28957.1 ClpXP protease specificity-enhancing factor [Wenzhouxiangella sp. 15181]RFP68335.1 ClpXP protease specificity-enhancing factor [Wenzhouxiangella sp. 15190]